MTVNTELKEETVNAQFLTGDFVRKPFRVKAVQVSRENMRAVADWCRGTVRHMKAKPDEGLDAKDYISVPVLKPLNPRQTRAFIGDWVLLSGQSSFKVYTTETFFGTFDPVEKNSGNSGS